MRARWLAALLVAAGLGLYAAVGAPMQRQATAAADEYKRARDEARDIRARLARLERRDAAHARAAAALPAAATPADTVRAVRRVVVQTLQEAHVSGVRLGVSAARAPYAARVRLSAAGPFAQVVSLAGLLARPERGLVLEKVRFSPRGETVSLDLEGVTLGASP
ncbi:MAG: hypothetical protein DMF78_20110 [Acidobacteria bacterium]|nr:MAG: hypothetical protein DMF78_20110 [Acidobacteriota bacterium]